MTRENTSILRCPACRGSLSFGETEKAGSGQGQYGCACGTKFALDGGVADFTWPRQLPPTDAEFRKKYDETAAKYDSGLQWLFRSFYEDPVRFREDLVALLGLKPGQRVLEVGCGTGEDSKTIARQIGAAGELWVQDISRGMVELAREKLAEVQTPIHFSVANASYLPFADGVFDAVFHFGGVNTFDEKQRSLEEMARVTKKGGKVVVGDESVPPWQRERFFGKVLMNANPLYCHQPPLECLPENVRGVCLRWVLGGAFYVIDFSVGDGPPPVDLDLPIPGKGDSLRSRYENRSFKKTA
jgi:ubiquinone/menaquinone biosynthesis C-methylase UbiE